MITPFYQCYLSQQKKKHLIHVLWNRSENCPLQGLSCLKPYWSEEHEEWGRERQWRKEAIKSLKYFLPCIPGLLQTYPAVPMLCWQAVLTCAWKCSLNCRQASGVYHWKERTALGQTGQGLLGKKPNWEKKPDKMLVHGVCQEQSYPGIRKG